MATSPPVTEPKLPPPAQKLSLELGGDAVSRALDFSSTVSVGASEGACSAGAPMTNNPRHSGALAQASEQIQELSDATVQLEDELLEKISRLGEAEELVRVKQALLDDQDAIHKQRREEWASDLRIERTARAEAEDATARLISERQMLAGDVDRLRAELRRWEAKYQRAVAEGKHALAVAQAAADSAARQNAGRQDELRQALKECEEDRINGASQAELALRSAAQEHEAMGAAVAARDVSLQNYKHELERSRHTQARAEAASVQAAESLEAARAELQERVAFERGERIKLERKNEKLSKALRLERTRRMGCPVCRRNTERWQATPTAAAPTAEAPGGGEARAGVEVGSAIVVSDSEARRLLGVRPTAGVAEVKQAYRREVL